MDFEQKWYKKLAAVGLSLALLLTGVLGVNISGISTGSGRVVQADDSSVKRDRASIHDGAILHAFCWNFNTIKSNMADIAAAGYTAVQTSPINECLATHPELQIHGDGMWYYHYQPTDWKIGNYQLGTRDEFTAMCEEAHKYGVGVIVDILPNHTTPSKEQVSQDLLDAAGGTWESLLHKEIADASGRVATTYTYNGLLDVDTENTGFQQYFYEFLMDCLACGADGFRIDTTKHIALPDDPVPAEYEDKGRNQFFPNMKKAIDEKGVSHEETKVTYADLFVYGETLQESDGGERTAAYQSMLGGTTASNYGAAIRTALADRDFSVSKISDYQIYDEGSYTADANKLVTWVESHDNYSNDGEDSWKVVSDEDVRLGWAIIGARKDGTPLFFSRPMNSSADNPWGDNVLGAAGNNEYKSAEVAAVNQFRKAMAGKDEKLRNPGGNVQVLMIERGNTGADGAVIVNGSSANVVLDSETELKDGTYVNAVAGEDSRFTVKNGVINGTLPARSVVVLTDQADTEATSVFFYNADNWSTVKASVNSVSYDATSSGDGWWSVIIPGTEFEITFTDGDTKKSAAFQITSTSGRYTTSSGDAIYASKEEAEKAIGVDVVSVYFFNTQSWDTVNAYAWLEDGTKLFGEWPGAIASYDGGFWYRADVKFMDVKDFSIIFSGDEKQTENIAITASDITKGSDGSLSAYVAPDQNQGSGNLAAKVYSSMDEPEDALGISGRRNFSTAYFYNADGWDQVSVYTWGDLDLGEWPGTPAEEDGDGWYKLRLNAAPGSNLNIIFNNGNQGEQTGNLAVDDIQKRYFLGKAGQKYASKEEALEALANPVAAVEKSRVWYYDENAWDAVNLYIWSDNAEYQECLGGWPGASMQSAGDGWYSVEAPAAALMSGEANLIFNGGGGQLDDVHPKDAEHTYYSTTSAKADQAYASRAETFQALGKSLDTLLVYYYNKDKWEGVSTYVWGDKEALGGWPGEPANYIGDNWWMIEIPGTTSDVMNVIFNNNGGGSQTPDIHPVGAVTYGLADGSSFATKKEALDALGVTAPDDGNASVKKTKKITVKSLFKKAYGAKAFSLGASVTANEALTYKSNNKKVATVSAAGKVTIKGTGKATITVTSAESENYTAASATVTLKVVPKKAVLSSAVQKKSGKITVTWKRDTRADGYLIRYATNKKLKNAKTVTIKKNTKTSSTISVKKGKVYYVTVIAYKTIDKKKAKGAASKVKSVKAAA